MTAPYPAQSIAASELILGGQKSGKSRRAELLARQWLDADPQHSAVLIATAQPWDEEMRQRITRHQSDRAQRVPGMRTLEEPRQLAAALAELSQPHQMVVVDCLTLWLTNWMMPMEPASSGEDGSAHGDTAPVDALLAAIAQAPGPLVLVGNEIGLGVIPMGAQVRAFVDALGRLNQQVAAVCERATLMAAGLPLVLKGAP